jgi:hypothetical protein
MKLSFSRTDLEASPGYRCPEYDIELCNVDDKVEENLWKCRGKLRPRENGESADYTDGYRC